MDSYPILAAILLLCSVLLMSALGLPNLPEPPTAEQIAAAEQFMDGYCMSCPVYEILEPAATAAADDTTYPPLSRTLP